MHTKDSHSFDPEDPDNEFSNWRACQDECPQCHKHNVLRRLRMWKGDDCENHYKCQNPNCGHSWEGELHAHQG